MLKQLGHVKQHSLRAGQHAFPGDAPSARRRPPVVAVRASATPTEPAPAAPQQQPPAVTLDDSRTQAFMNWARGPASIRFAGVKPSTFAGIRGLAASSDIANDALIVEVPRRSAVVLAPKQRNSCPGMVTDDWWKGAPWFAKMGAMLIWHKRQGGQSPLAPWIAQLPADAGVPLTWSDKQLAALQYPYLQAQVKEQQREWSGLYDALRSSGMAAGAAAPSREEFWWAMSVVRSRTFSGPYIGSTLSDRLRLAGLVAALVVGNTALGLADPQKTLSAAIAVFLFNVLYEVILSRSLKQYAICPLIDLFNHTSAAQSEVSYNYFGDSYSVVASRDFKKGEQVFITYGAQSNDSLMQYYGFAELDNPQDTYVISDMLRWVEGFRPVPAARLQALRGSSLGAAALTNVVVQRAGFPAEALQALRFLLASDAEAAAGVSAFSKAGSTEAEALLAEALACVVTAELAAAPTSLKEDLALQASGSSGSGGKKGGAGSATAAEAMALSFRIEKKKVLSAVLKNMGG
ncbi:hypothetical protein HYH02_014196 [Chlamydomonas schloesseri]|uniref:SET domain-containing protein n=1 Tax=Chlamydomonas schloesseri TaxID=2026947 RepID=A0A835SKQ7_9CHLO|nr:hypothetical protein HYH02_014196 [Chlamydomonas schloesseri]|eukprot:KAG2428873.1 hypothetical protein HYH02_014196 [Chlamydomonas schloesseri]